MLAYKGVCSVVQTLVCNHRGGMHFILILVVCFMICQCCCKPKLCGFVFVFFFFLRPIFHTYIFKDESSLHGCCSSLSSGQWELWWAVITA